MGSNRSGVIRKRRLKRRHREAARLLKKAQAQVAQTSKPSPVTKAKEMADAAVKKVGTAMKYAGEKTQESGKPPSGGAPAPNPHPPAKPSPPTRSGPGTGKA